MYNNRARWDKEASLYKSFGGSRSAFGYLTYLEAKQRKEILQPMFSKRAIVDMQGLIQQKVNRLINRRLNKVAYAPNLDRRALRYTYQE